MTNVQYIGPTDGGPAWRYKGKTFGSPQEIIEALEGRVGEQARIIRNVQRAVQRNENRELNMGDAWMLIKEAVDGHTHEIEQR
jgi:hypothetical protein